MRRMRTSKAGMDLIKRFEGYRARAAQQPDGTWTIGYSHTQSAREDLRISKADAEAVLREYDLPPIEYLIGANVLAPLNQNQFDALVSFVFNIGAEAFQRSDVLTRLNSGASLAAAEAMMAWRKARVNGQPIVVDALVRRRVMEQALFLKHPNGAPVAPSGFIRPMNGAAPAELAGAGLRVEPEWEAREPAVDDMPAAKAEQDIAPTKPEENAGPTPDEITRAISALANPSQTLRSDEVFPPVRIDELPAETLDLDHEDLPPPPFIEEATETNLDVSGVAELDALEPVANGKTFIDDLAPATIDPELLKQAEANGDTPIEGIVPVATSRSMFHFGLGFVGVVLAGLFGLRLTEEGLPDFSDASDLGQYLTIGGVVLGVFLILMALAFMLRRNP